MLPFSAAFNALVAATLLFDAALHLFDAFWIGRYLGIPGTLLILGSFGYSFRKRGLIKTGNPVRLLRLHEHMAWGGSLSVLIHGGTHFNALLPWLAVAAMLFNVASGLIGKFLLHRSQRDLDETRQQMRRDGLAESYIEERLYWDSVTYAAVKQWRRVHFPVTLAFASLAIAHIVAIFSVLGMATSRPWALLLVAVVLLLILAARFVFPMQMVSPGLLSTGHPAVAARCFVCHTPGV